MMSRRLLALRLRLPVPASMRAMVAAPLAAIFTETNPESRAMERFVYVKRGEDWELVKQPPLEDWLELLDTVRRRINRRLLRPEEETSVKKMIYDRFPGTKID